MSAKKQRWLFLSLLLIVNSLTHGKTVVDTLRWIRTGGPLGGLGYDVRMRPDNPDIMFVTDAWAGVHKSTDGGVNWFPSNSGITTRAGDSGDAIPVFSLTIDRNNQNIIWVGTQNAPDIYKSQDGGDTWMKKNNGIVENNGISFRGFTVDPISSDIVYAAGEIASWVWNGAHLQGNEFDKTKGVVYKTTDCGENWSKIWQGNNLARYIFIDLRDTDVLYLSTGIFDREAADSDYDTNTPGGEGVLKSIDGGLTWKNINTGIENLYIGTLIMHPDNPDILLAGAGNNVYTQGEGVYLTQNGGTTWQKALSDLNVDAIEFAPTDPRIAYAGGPSAIYRSIDTGITWTKMTTGTDWGAPGVRAGFPIDFEVDPNNPDRIFANNYGGGNFLSEDGGAHWTVASAGYTGAQVRGITIDPTNPARLFVAARSGIFRSENGGSEWMGLNFAPASNIEWSIIEIHPTNSEMVLASCNADANLYKSEDSGESWVDVSPNMPNKQACSAICFSPSEPHRIYAGTSVSIAAGRFDPKLPASGIFTSTDNGDSWDEANDNQTSDAGVIHLAVEATNSLIVYAATGNKGLLKTVDGGQNWTQLTQGLPDSSVFTSVAIHPFDPSKLLTTVQEMGAYKSEDSGHSWQQVMAGLIPEPKFSDIVYDPINPDNLYLAEIRTGVYQSVDGGNNWQQINEGLHMRAVNKLSISYDGQHLYAATEGEGVFRLDVDGQIPTRIVHSDRQPNKFILKQNFPNPFNPVTNIEYEIPNEAHVKIEIINLNGQIVRSLVNRRQSVGSYVIQWDGIDNSGNSATTGIYFCRMTSFKQFQIQKMTLLK